MKATHNDVHEGLPGRERLMNAHSPHFIRSRIGKICVAIIGSTPAEMIEKAHEAVRENTFIEFRLDYLRQPACRLSETQAVAARAQRGHCHCHLPPGRDRRQIQGHNRRRAGNSARKPHPPAFTSSTWNSRPPRPQARPAGQAARARRGADHQLPRLRDHEGPRRHLRAHPAVRARIHQDRLDGQDALPTTSP